MTALHRCVPAMLAIVLLGIAAVLPQAATAAARTSHSKRHCKQARHARTGHRARCVRRRQPLTRHPASAPANSPTPALAAKGAPASRPAGGVPATGAAATAGTTVPPATPASGKPLFGYNDQSINYGYASAAEDALFSKRGGASVARITFDWRWAEPRRDVYDFSRYDALYTALKAEGIRPVWVVLFSPSWTWDSSVSCNQYTQDCRYPPGAGSDDQWKQIVGMLAQRYPDSAAIEIWNEPNMSFFWEPHPDPARYTQLLQEAHGAVKAVQPSMPVISGGLVNIDSTGGGNVSFRDFLQGIYANGGKSSMDGIGLHIYPHKYADWFDDAYGGTTGVRDANGDSAKPIWVTETGISTSDPNWAWSEEQQAGGLVSVYQALASKPDVRAVIIHTLVDRAGASGTEYGYGVRRTDLTPKPAYCRLATAVGSAAPCP